MPVELSEYHWSLLQHKYPELCNEFREFAYTIDFIHGYPIWVPIWGMSLEHQYELVESFFEEKKNISWVLFKKPEEPWEWIHAINNSFSIRT